MPKGKKEKQKVEEPTDAAPNNSPSITPTSISPTIPPAPVEYNLKLRKYYGSEDNVEEWIKHFKNVSNANNWTDRIAKCQLQDKLVRTAQGWLNSYLSKQDADIEEIEVDDILIHFIEKN